MSKCGRWGIPDELRNREFIPNVIPATANADIPDLEGFLDN